MSAPTHSHKSLYTIDKLTKKRNASEYRFRLYGIMAICIAVGALFFLLGSVVVNGMGSFRQAFITLDVQLDAAKLDKKGNLKLDDIKKITTIGYQKLISTALLDKVNELGLNTDKLSKKQIAGLLSKEAPATLRNMVLADPNLIGQTVNVRFLANGRIDGYFKGRVTPESAKLDNNISPEQLKLADALRKAGIMTVSFNSGFIFGPDASEVRPEAAGIGIAIVGSLYLMLIVLVLSLPIGIAASIYLEEFAPKNKFTDLIEVNISNLAAVPSIVFGILGLSVFINFMGLPQSTPIVGGLVLTLMTLPTIIIATRAAIKAVPPSIRDAALGVGASKMQTVFHHVLPLALPGIMTGAIIGLAQAMGETAPLLLIGMVAFVRDFPAAPPEGFFDPASALPVQVYNFTRRADPGFVERASGTIIVLLVFLILMNLIAVILRKRYERRW